MSAVKPCYTCGKNPVEVPTYSTEIPVCAECKAQHARLREHDEKRRKGLP